MSYEYCDDEEEKDPLAPEKKRTRPAARALEERSEASRIPEKYGLCSTCKWMDYRATMYGREAANCEIHETRGIRPDDPIKVCSGYDKAGQMSLTSMWSIATLIEADNKIKVGFNLEEEV